MKTFPAKNTDSKTTDSFKITGDWASQSEILKGKFAQLTDADLQFEPGKENELLLRVEKRLHKKREEVMNIIKKGFPPKV